MKRRTIVVEGPLAYRMRRAHAAHAGELGVQVMTFPQVAARLSGGFARPAEPLDLDPAIRDALDEGGFREIENMRRLPGMGRAVAHTLAKLWDADLSPRARDAHDRLEDVQLIIDRVRSKLPPGSMTPPDLRDAALRRIDHAAAVLGTLEIDGVIHVEPVWRPLVLALRNVLDVSWRTSDFADVAWLPDGATAAGGRHAPTGATSCANPRAESVEALRWMRELMASGRAKPSDIAICATDTSDWDPHFLILAEEADLPLHFSHGRPALASRGGQTCAALADLLLGGLSQDGVRRLLRLVSGQSGLLRDTPQDWARTLERAAPLTDLDRWVRALGGARDVDGLRRTLLPALALLAKGKQAAGDAGAAILSGRARSLWDEALRQAPADALDLSLRRARLPDRRDPSASVVWCPADHLANAPRPFVRLLGLTSRCWPRPHADDPLLPHHIVARADLAPVSVPERDRRAFRIIVSQSSGECVLSHSRRNAAGGLLAASPLLAAAVPELRLATARLPEHAFSEADRLLARPEEATSEPAIVAAQTCWRNWGERTITGHDGRVRANHPAILRALGTVQSATSLQLLLGDPLAYVWKYVLGWRSVEDGPSPMILDPPVFGEFVHEVLKRAVDALETGIGYARAPQIEIEAAVTEAATRLGAEWPLRRLVPPRQLWEHLVETAARLALNAMTQGVIRDPGTRSWTEVPFGLADPGDQGVLAPPWPPSATVMLPGTSVQVKGNIDRLDVNAAGDGRVFDYKTGAPPRTRSLVLGHSAELQRAIYAIAARRLLPGTPRVAARLVYLGGAAPEQHILSDSDVDRTASEIVAHINAAYALLRAGTALPGPEAHEPANEFRLARPAAGASYGMTKHMAAEEALGTFTTVWGPR